MLHIVMLFTHYLERGQWIENNHKTLVYISLVCKKTYDKEPYHFPCTQYYLRWCRIKHFVFDTDMNKSVFISVLTLI